jgi:hypothetical protein
LRLLALMLVAGVSPASAHLDTLWLRALPYSGENELVGGLGLDRQGNVYAARTWCHSPTGNDVYVVKYDSSGNQQWLSIDSTGTNCSASCAVVDSSGYVFVTGLLDWEDTAWHRACATWKFSPFGVLEWRAICLPPKGQASGAALACCPDGGVVVAGSSVDSLGQSYLQMLRYGPGGNLIWADASLSDTTASPNCVRATSDGSVFVGCGSYGWTLVKYGPDGTLLNVITHGVRATATGIEDMALDGEGGVLVTGSCACQGTPDVCTARYGADGSETWMNHFDGPGHIDDVGVAIVAVDSGGAYVTGQAGRLTNDYDCVVIRYLPTGETAWARCDTLGGQCVDIGTDIAMDRDSAVYVAATRHLAGPRMLKYSPSGVNIWEENGPPSLGADNITVDALGNVYSTCYGPHYVAKYTQTKEWGIFVFQNGDNTLERALIEDLNQMEAGVDMDSCYVVSQLDRIAGFDTSNGDWTDTRRLFVTPDTTRGDTIRSGLLEDIGEANMGAGTTLVNFVSWAARRFPARKYCLICADHGYGWPFGDPPRLDFSEDMTNGDAIRVAGENREMNRALKVIHDSLGRNLDLLCFDACFMAMLEVGYESKDYADLIVGSEEMEPGAGYPYTEILRWLGEHQSASPAELGSAIVTEYVNSYKPGGGQYCSTSVVHSSVTLGWSQVALAEKLNRFAEELIAAGGKENPRIVQARNACQPYNGVEGIDAEDFANLISLDPQLPDTLRAAATDLSEYIDTIVSAQGQYSDPNDRSLANSNGIALYYPKGDPWFLYKALGLADATLWDEFIGCAPGIAQDRVLRLRDTLSLEVSQNPMTNRCEIPCAQPKGEDVSVSVLSSLGAEVRTLSSHRKVPGRYTLGWDGRDNAGRSMSAGVYFVRMTAGHSRLQRKLVLLR